MARRARWCALLLLGVLGGAPLARADTAPMPELMPGGCDARILVQLTHGLRRPPDQAWLEALGAAAGVQLRYLRALTPQLHLFRLRDDHDGSDCDQALERLRHDPRVRSAELDKRRKHESA